MWDIIVEIILAFTFVDKQKKHELRLFLRRIWTWLKVRNRVAYFGKCVTCGKTMQVTKKTYISDYTSLGSVRIMGGGIAKIGSHCRFGDDLIILTDNHNYEGSALPYDKTNITKDVIIEDNCWIGMRVTLLPGTVLKEGCIVQSGSVVHGVIPPLSIIGGNPAKVFKTRNKEHYYKLKEEGRFYCGENN